MGQPDWLEHGDIAHPPARSGFLLEASAGAGAGAGSEGSGDEGSGAWGVGRAGVVSPATSDDEDDDDEDEGAGDEGGDTGRGAKRHPLAREQGRQLHRAMVGQAYGR